MRTAGIIAEYNPFHNGHAWQIAELKKRGFEAVVCVCSPGVVQRGTAALFPARVRTRAALAAGALIAKWAALICSGVFLPTVLTADHVGVPTRRCFLGRHNLESLLKQENGRKAYAGSAFILQGIPRSVNGKRRNNRKFTNFPLIFPSPHPMCRRVPPTRMPP